MMSAEMETIKMHRILNLLHLDHLDDGYLNTADPAEVTFKWVFDRECEQVKAIEDTSQDGADSIDIRPSVWDISTCNRPANTGGTDDDLARPDLDDSRPSNTNPQDTVTDHTDQGTGTDEDADDSRFPDSDAQETTEDEPDAKRQHFNIDRFLIPEYVPPLFGLNAWLATGEGIFHITGKMGSGKSTMMKYICDDPQTVEQLRKWAGPYNKLAVAHFFFTRDGYTQQRKLTGLCRALLAAVLSQIPDDIPHVFSDLCMRLDSSIVDTDTSGSNITDPDIRSAFDLLIHRAGNDPATAHRLCFFIDGLDQMEEDVHTGHWELADLLRKWVDDSYGAVKICVSSREVPVFLRQLYPVRRVRLEDYTGTDMESLAHHSLNKDPYFRRLEKDHPEEMRRLTRRLVRDSEGIFYWIGYNLQAFRKTLVNRAPWSKIRQLSNLSCIELEQHFKNLQLSIRKEDQVESNIVFALLRFELRVCRISNFSLLSYAFLAEIIEDSDFPKSYPLNASPDYSELGVLLEDASIRLRGTCAGLVELRGAPYYSTHTIWPHVLDELPLLSQHLAFTHGTVLDCVDEALNPQKDTSYLSDSSMVELAIHLLIVRIKAIPFPEIAPVSVIWRILGFKPPGSPDTYTTYKEDSNSPDWDILEILLRSGRADPLLYIETIPQVQGQDGITIVFYYQHEVAHLPDFQPRDVVSIFRETDGRPRWYLLRTIYFNAWLAEMPDMRCSLRDLVQFLWPYNVDRLLKLIDEPVMADWELVDSE